MVKTVLLFLNYLSLTTRSGVHRPPNLLTITALWVVISAYIMKCPPRTKVPHPYFHSSICARLRYHGLPIPKYDH